MGGRSPRFGSLGLGQGIVWPSGDEVAQEESAREKSSCPFENCIYPIDTLIVMVTATVSTIQTVILPH
jgi:hypothetical protein